MADIRISQLPELGVAPADSDVLVINDVSVSSTKSITFGTLTSNIAKNIVDSDTGVKISGSLTVNNNVDIDGQMTAATGEITTLEINTIQNTSGPNASVNVTSNMKLFDSDELRLGDGNDLKIFHDGFNSYISEGGAGNLILETNGNGLVIRPKNVNSNFISCLWTGSTNPGQTRLFYVNPSTLAFGRKLNTYDSGCQVSGFMDTDILKVGDPRVPTSATDTGQAGEIAWDADYIYVCVAANTWKRVQISTWP